MPCFETITAVDCGNIGGSEDDSGERLFSTNGNVGAGGIARAVFVA
ncbi:MAG: hypothetical protein WB952_08645 [Terriglobales bacterium]